MRDTRPYKAVELRTLIVLNSCVMNSKKKIFETDILIMHCSEKKNERISREGILFWKILASITPTCSSYEAKSEPTVQIHHPQCSHGMVLSFSVRNKRRIEAYNTNLRKREAALFEYNRFSLKTV